MENKLINTTNLYALIDFEPFVILSSLVLLAWLFYKFFLRDVSEERHTNLRNHFLNLLRHYFICSGLFFFSLFLLQANDQSWSLGRSLPYIAILTFIWGIMVFVKVTRLIILQYLFLGSMRAGVPVLIVNIFSLGATLVLVLFGVSHIFGVQIAPLLATSAALSIVLGLALQDTLGNLFAGISLQVDHTFEIGDWIEVTNAGQKITGQVKEITWRATLLTGWSDELITIPNRLMANAQLSNFQSGNHPIARSQSFIVPYSTDLDLAKKCLIAAVKTVESIREFPAPQVFIKQNGESSVTLRISYFIDNYGTQHIIADHVIDKCIGFLKANNIEVGHNVLQIISNSEKK